MYKNYKQKQTVIILLYISLHIIIYLFFHKLNSHSSQNISVQLAFTEKNVWAITKIKNVTLDWRKQVHDTVIPEILNLRFLTMILTNIMNLHSAP